MLTAAPPLDRLKDARRRGVSWPTIIEALRELEAPGPTDEKGRRWILVAAELTGYSPNQLRQAERAIAAVDKLLSRPHERDAALGWPITSLEVVARIAALDPERARDLLTRSVVPTIRSLRLIHEQVQAGEGARLSPQSAGHRSARAFNDTLIKSLSASPILRRILGLDRSPHDIQLVAWPGGFRYAHPTCLAVEDDGLNGRLHAFQGLRLIGDLNLDGATKAIVRAAVESTCFATYHLVVTRQSDAEALDWMSGDLGLANLGVLILGDGLPEVLIRPSGPPRPDRQAMLLEDNHMRGRLGLRPLNKPWRGSAF